MDEAFLSDELSSETLAALRQHLQSQTATDAPAANTTDATSDQSAPDIVSENFGLSQFWYTEDTCNKFVDECLALAASRFANQPECRIVCISCPSIFYALQKRRTEFADNVVMTLLEYDERFAKHFPTSYHFYDVHRPSTLPPALYNAYDIVLADPPYINPETMQNIGLTMKLMCRNFSSSCLLLNTGLVLRKDIERQLQLKCCTFAPAHRVGLMNEFATYTNYQSEILGGWRAAEE